MSEIISYSPQYSQKFLFSEFSSCCTSPPGCVLLGHSSYQDSWFWTQKCFFSLDLFWVIHTHDSMCFQLQVELPAALPKINEGRSTMWLFVYYFTPKYNITHVHITYSICRLKPKNSSNAPCAVIQQVGYLSWSYFDTTD